MHDQLANTVEKEEGITAGLWVSWATRFCQNAGARRGRSSGGNGGRLWCCAAGGEKCNWGWRLGRAGVGGFKTRLAMPGCPRRVSSALRRAATSGATRPADSEPVGHDGH